MLFPDLLVKGVFDVRSFLASAVVVPSDFLLCQCALTRRSFIILAWLGIYVGQHLHVRE
jgi:hypothetical protein